MVRKKAPTMILLVALSATGLFGMVVSAQLLPPGFVPIVSGTLGGWWNDFGAADQREFLNSDDGTEADRSTWLEDGVTLTRNYIGSCNGSVYDAGMRFRLDDLDQGDQVAFARLRFPSLGGEIESLLKLRLEGVLQESPSTFSQSDRPSQKAPGTESHVQWTIGARWKEGNCTLPLYYSSPDVAPIVNEILALPGWGSGVEGKTLIMRTRCENSLERSLSNYVVYDDSQSADPDVTTHVILEIYRTVYDAFIGKELLGRPTDTSVTVNLYSLLDVDVYVMYGRASGFYTDQTPVLSGRPAEKPVGIVIENLAPDTRYYYRLMYRKAGAGPFEMGDERSFHTQRIETAEFSFSVMADSHLEPNFVLPARKCDISLYRRTLQNIAACGPDFFISVGDFAFPEIKTFGGYDARSLNDAKNRYLRQRSFIDRIGHSIPFYLVIGNHEGEQGWYFNNHRKDDQPLPLFAAEARKQLIPNPFPDGFYSGHAGADGESGYAPEHTIRRRESYFAWEWGDALFVALDPYWNTVNKPHGYPTGPATNDGWDWTLGKKQYDWLQDTLYGSDAKWKFVFIHHLTSSTVTGHKFAYYGRGGIEIAKHKVSHNASFEWGGENENGDYIFESKRPGWDHGAIHDMLVAENVTMVIHGHDHFFAKQNLDGIVYVECPQSSDACYTMGFAGGNYEWGDLLPNSGHVQVTVAPQTVRLDYIRSYLPGDGPNGEIAYSHTVR